MLQKQERDKKSIKYKKVQLDSIIILDSKYEIYGRSGSFDIKNSYNLERKLAKNINIYCDNSDVSFLNLTTSNLENLTIDQINANFIIKEWKREMNESYEEKNVAFNSR